MKQKIAFYLVQFMSFVLVPFYLIKKKKKEVLHISYDIHIANFTVKILREHQILADYLAVGSESKWNADIVYSESFGHLSAKEQLREFLFFWKVVANYPIMHSHFMMTTTSSGWELPFYKWIGGKWLVHGRGCAERNRNKNIELHPKLNICSNCDYSPRICEKPINQKRRALTKKYADLMLVTTPDMKDFWPKAVHMPFFTPPVEVKRNKIGDTTSDSKLIILHVTNHPGIEGTVEIEKCIDSLKSKGLNIEFLFLKGVSNQVVMEAYSKADLSIGKMKMGCYANAQIESLYCGVPAITWVREEFITDDIRNSGLILSHLDDLENTISYYYHNREALKEKQKICVSSVGKLHNNREIALKYKEIYVNLLSKSQ